MKALTQTLRMNPRDRLILTGLLATAFVWVANNSLHDYLADKFAFTSEKATQPARQADHLRNLYPLLATAKRAAAADIAPASGAQPVSLDELFGKTDHDKAQKAKDKKEKPQATDYFAALSERKKDLLSLDGLSPGSGAVINGSYVAIGRAVDSVSYPSNAAGTHMVAPRLVAVTDSSVTIQEPAGHRTITLQIPSRN